MHLIGCQDRWWSLIDLPQIASRVKHLQNCAIFRSLVSEQLQSMNMTVAFDEVLDTCPGDVQANRGEHSCQPFASGLRVVLLHCCRFHTWCQVGSEYGKIGRSHFSYPDLSPSPFVYFGLVCNTAYSLPSTRHVLFVRSFLRGP